MMLLLLLLLLLLFRLLFLGSVVAAIVAVSVEGVAVAFVAGSGIATIIFAIS